MRFDLIDEPWVPVVGSDGTRRELSLWEALVGAPEVARLAPETPTMVPALLRQVLLPVVRHAYGAPRDEADWGRRWREGRLAPDVLDRYLDEHRDRFDLFHPMHPFGQVAGLRSAKDVLHSSSRLVPAIASGNNVPLFSVRTADEPPAFSPAEAVRWMLHLQCWDTAGIQTGAVGDPRVKGGKVYGTPTGPLGQVGVVVPVGENLFETLMLNLPIRAAELSPDDLPHWRRAPLTAEWQPREPEGLLDLFTWQARRVRLVPEEWGGRVVVRSVLVTAGDRTPVVPPEEPHTTWRRVDKPRPGDPPRRPRRHQPGREAWRGLDALLAVRSGHDADAAFDSSALLSQAADLRVSGQIDPKYPLGVEVAGIVYGNMQAVVDHVVTDALPLPVAALEYESEVRDLVEWVTQSAGELEAAVNRLDANLRRAAGGDPTPWDKGQRPGTRLVHQLDPVVRRLLAGLQRRPELVDEAETAWRVTAQRLAYDVAERLLTSVPPHAFKGRVSTDGKSTWRVSMAEARFRRDVRKVLSGHDEDEPDDGSEHMEVRAS